MKKIINNFKITLKNQLRSFAYLLGPKKHSELLYYKEMNKRLNLSSPTTFNEKLMWLKLYEDNHLKAICADKLEVRKFVSDKGESQCLNELYNFYNSSNEIRWEELPNSFVLKVNNTSGANIICPNKENLDIALTSYKLDKWLQEKFYKNYSEMHYKNIEPKIICEKYLKPKKGLLPDDFKLFCFHGITKVVMVCTERETGNPKFYMTDLNGKILPYNPTGKKAIEMGETYIKLPSSIGEMDRIARKLAKDFTFVRADFYDIDGNVVFGELTFTPQAGMDSNILEEGERTMGDWITLPPKK